MDGRIYVSIFSVFFLSVCESRATPLKTSLYLHHDNDLESLAH